MASKAAEEKSGPKLDSPPTYGRSAVITLFVALAIYAYQTNFLSSLFNRERVIESTTELDGRFGFRNESLPKVEISSDDAKKTEIVEAFKHAWAGYERDAMGNDEYHPLTKKGSNLTEAGGIGYMVVDSLDTMLLMGLTDEYTRARDWIINKLSFDRDGNFNTFETTIRVLGGLLSAYHLSGDDPIYLEKAKELADRILPVFDTPSGLPLSMVNLGKKEVVDDPHVPGIVSTSEATTLQLELKYLSYLTDDDTYWDKAEGVMKIVKSAGLPSGLAPIYMNAETGQFKFAEIRLGSRGDSFYEYLLKQYLQTNKNEPVYLELYQQTMEAIYNNLLGKGVQFNSTYTKELIPDRKMDGTVEWRLSPKQDHLVCFLGGSLMLGATTTALTGSSVSVPPHASELTPAGRRDWQLGYELIETCVDTYKTATGLSAEIVHFYVDDDREYRHKERDWYIKGNTFPGQPSYDARYILRPETVESLFIAYRLTGDPKYREYGWKIFEAIQKYCRVEDGGYSSILNVDSASTIKMDKMETFFLSETLKYLYLLFSDENVMSLDKYVFNTEAHPFPVFTPATRTGYF